MTTTNFAPALAVSELPDGANKAVSIGGLSILLCHHEGSYHALENRCSHAEAPLECGRMRNGFIVCPAHGARFDLQSGEALSGPANEPVKIFALRLVDGMIEVAV